jgi:hypothetical protein
VFLNLLFAMIMIFAQQILAPMAFVLLNQFCVMTTIPVLLMLAMKPPDVATIPLLTVMITTFARLILAPPTEHVFM